MFPLKGPCHEIFFIKQLVFFIKQLHLGPRPTDLSLFAYGFEFAEIFEYEIDFFVISGVNETADQWWAVSMTPLTSSGRCQ
jgi:hypothetical protein